MPSLIAAIGAELLVPSSPAAFAVPVFILVEGVVVWRSFRLYARLDPSGLLIKNFANTHELRWDEIHEITPVNDFGLSNLTVGFHLHDQSGFLAPLPAAQVTSHIAARGQKEALLEALDHYSAKHHIPSYLELDENGEWRVPTDAEGDRVARAGGEAEGAALPVEAPESVGDYLSSRMGPTLITLVTMGPVIAVGAGNSGIGPPVAIAATAAALALGLALGIGRLLWRRRSRRG